MEVLDFDVFYIKAELNSIFKDAVLLFLSTDGTYCQRCQLLQGFSKNGLKKFYCRHVIAMVERRMKKRKKLIAQRFMALYQSRLLQDEQIGL